MRVLMAGVLGAIAMFVASTVLHVATPLANTGVSRMSNEEVVLDAMKRGVEKPGLYIFPWVDPNDPKMMEKSAALMKVNPSGMMIVQPSGGMFSMAPALGKEFVKELAQALIAAFLLSLTALSAWFSRVGFVALMALFAELGTDTSYWIWYGFPANYTLAVIAIGLIQVIVAGLVIAAIVKPRFEVRIPLGG
jgi:hypothetical protein